MVTTINGQTLELSYEGIINAGDFVVTPEREVYEVTNIIATLPSEAQVRKTNLKLDQIPQNKRAVGGYYLQ